MTQTVSCNPGTGAVNCVRWAQIELTTATLGPAGSGTYGSDGEYRFFPDLAVNHCDDMVVGYSHSSSSSWPSVASTGRLSTDPAGTLQAETIVKAGEISYTAFDSPPRRWGDHTGTMLAANTQYFWRVRAFNMCGPGEWASIFSFTTVAISCQTFTATDVGQTITDSTPAISSLVVGELTITDVNAQVDIDHTFVGDLDIVLTAPGGASVTLLDRPGSPASGSGCGDSNMSVLFDDESTSGVDLENHCAGSDPWYVGDALPVAPLTAFDTLQPAGPWTLTVNDNAGGDDGTIVGWSLEICFDSGPVLPDEIFQDGFETGDTSAWAEGGP